jgi:hypothetical protein
VKKIEAKSEALMPFTPHTPLSQIAEQTQAKKTDPLKALSNTHSPRNTLRGKVPVSVIFDRTQSAGATPTQTPQMAKAAGEAVPRRLTHA